VSMRKMVSFLIILLIILLMLFFVAGFNLGKWIDVTQKPVKSDIIVCLGGGTIDRVKKSIELLKEGYARQNVFVLLGESWYNQPYIKKNYPKLPIVIEEGPKNTAEEIKFIKKYMKENAYKNALIITDPPHSRRVSLLTSWIRVEGDENMKFRIIKSDVKWWDREHYYNNAHARASVWHEMMGIVYGLISEW